MNSADYTCTSTPLTCRTQDIHVKHVLIWAPPIFTTSYWTAHSTHRRASLSRFLLHLGLVLALHMSENASDLAFQLNRCCSYELRSTPLLLLGSMSSGSSAELCRELQGFFAAPSLQAFNMLGWSLLVDGRERAPFSIRVFAHQLVDTSRTKPTTIVACSSSC